MGGCLLNSLMKKTKRGSGERPWFIQGLNLVLQPWEPFFDPLNADIVQVDQWVRTPRLPMEFWGTEFLKVLLKDVVIKVDQFTLERSRGKFARVCVNLDVTKNLPGKCQPSVFW